MDTIPITLTLRNLKPPTWEELTLTEAARSLGELSPDAFTVHSLDGLPSALRRIIKMARHMGRPSSVWRDESGRHWLFVELIQRCGPPVLAVDQYDEQGRLNSTCRWQQTPMGQWERDVLS